MIIADPEFLASSERDDKKVVVYVEVAATIDLRFVSRLTPEMNNTISLQYWEGLVAASVANPRSNFFDPSITQGRYSFTLSSKLLSPFGTEDDTIEKIVDEFLVGRTARIFVGFEEVDPDLYIQIALGKIADIQYDSGLWTFVLSDINNIFNAGMVTLPTSLCDGLQTSSGDIAKVSGGNFIFSDIHIDSLNAVGIHVLLKIEDELIEYSDLGGTTPNFFTVTQRGAYGTVAAEHADGTPIKQVLAFEMRPAQFMLHAILTGEGIFSRYNTGISFFGMGINTNFVNVDDFEHFDHSYSMHEGALSNRPIIIDEDISNGREFLEENFLRPAGATFAILGGVLTVRNLDWGVYAGAIAMKPNPVRSQTALNTGRSFGNKINNRDFFSNVFDIQYKKSVLGDNILSNVYSSDASILNFGEVKPAKLYYGSVIDDGTFNGSIHAINVNRGRWGKFYAQPAIVEVDSPLDNIILESGDETFLTDTKLPHLASATYGLFDSRLIISGVSFNLSGLSNSYQLVFNGYLFEAWRLIPNDVIFTSIGELSVSSQTASLNADKSGTFGASDAYTTTITTPWHVAIFEVELNHAGGGSDAEHFIRLQVGALVPPATTTFLAREDFFLIPFNPLFEIVNKRIFLYLFSTSDHIAQDLDAITSCQFKLDFWESTTTSENSPTVTLRDVHLIEFTDDISA